MCCNLLVKRYIFFRIDAVKFTQLTQGTLMNKKLLSLAAIVLISLPGCWRRKEKIVVQEKPVKKHQVKRVSGPLAASDVPWTSEDYGDMAPAA